MSDPDFTLGIEEEYLLVDPETLALTDAPKGLMEDCAADLDGQVSAEFHQCQIEIGTRVCRDIAEAREELKRLRSSIARNAEKHGVRAISASCHPFSTWKARPHTDAERYNALEKDLGSVIRRSLTCGMHVHTGISDFDLRADLMNQFTYFLPHLLALSASSPFWHGRDTELYSYRVSIFDNLPRSGLPPIVESWAEYERSVQVLIDLGIIEDSSKIWWDLRPSHAFPTLETRLCDAQPRLEHTLMIAALIQSTLRMLYRLARKNQRWRIYDRFLIGENRWRAQRYGVTQGLIDFGARKILPFDQIMDEWIDLISEDAGVLGCVEEIEQARDIVSNGNSAQRQRDIYKEALANGADDEAALRQIVTALVEEYHADL